MDKKTNKGLPPYVMLTLISIVMSFAIAGVYMLTKDTIAEAAAEAQAAARASVMEDAAVMTEYDLPDNETLDWLYEAYDADGNFMGYVGQVTVIGFGGEIEVTVGMDTTGTISGVAVGGANFSETSGLGAKTKEPAFTNQFTGKSGMLVLKQDIDSVSGASVSSGAVVSGVNKAVAYMKALLPEGSVASDAEPLTLTEAQLATVLPGASNAVWMGGGSGIDGWWQADSGYIVRATGFGEGPIVVTMGFDQNRVVTGIIIGDENFMESEGRGDRVLEEWYGEQFIGRSGVQTYGDGLDAISGATVTSDATLTAINACMGFDPATGASSAAAADAQPQDTDAATEATVQPDPDPPIAEPEPTPEPDAETGASAVEEEPAEETPHELKTITIPAYRGEPDAVTEASIPEEETAPTPSPTPAPSPTPTPDAVTEASIPEEETTPTPAPTPTPDAVTEASIPEEEATPTPAPTPTPDAVTEASIPEEG